MKKDCSTWSLVAELAVARDWAVDVRAKANTTGNGRRASEASWQPKGTGQKLMLMQQEDQTIPGGSFLLCTRLALCDTALASDFVLQTPVSSDSSPYE